MTQRDELLARWGQLLRDMPHEEQCPRQPPMKGNVVCLCETGERLKAVHLQMGALITQNAKGQVR